MADAKVSALTELTAPASADEFLVVDKSDTTDAASGTDKRITYGNVQPQGMIDASMSVATMQAVLDTFSVVQMKPGSYALGTSRLQLNDGQVLLGSGTKNTTISGVGTTLQGLLDGVGTLGSAVNLSANAAVGDKTISTSTNSNLVAGDYALVQSTTVVSYAGSEVATATKGEIVLVASSTASVVTLATHLVDSYTTAATATIKKITPKTGIVIRDLTIQQAAGNAAFGIRLQYTAGASISNVQIVGGEQTRIAIATSVGWNVDSCNFIRGSDVSPFGYGINVRDASTDGIVSNCHSHKGHGLVTTNAKGEGIPRFIKVIGCTAWSAYEIPFHTHEACERIEYVGCTVTGAPNDYAGAYYNGIAVFGRNCVVSNCTVTEFYGNAIVLEGDSSVVANCTADSIRTGSSALGIGVYLTANSTNCRVVNCSVSNADSSGYLLRGAGGVLVSSSSRNCPVGVAINAVDSTNKVIDFLAVNSSTNAVNYTAPASPSVSLLRISGIGTTTSTNKTAALSDSYVNVPAT